jgi:alpha/beta superfamily hydrolase
MRTAIRQPEALGDVTGRLHSIFFPGPEGSLEGLWKEAPGERRGCAVFAHPHPLHGGTMHNKVVYRAVQALTRSGFATLRFNFRGVGTSEGRYDAGRGEVEDFRAAMDEAVRRTGLPLLAGGFSFGSAVGLKAIVQDPRVTAFVALGLPLATESGRLVPRPGVPALYVVGERDAFGPPEDLHRFVAGSGTVVVVPGAGHFFEGSLESLGAIIEEFLSTIAPPGAVAVERIAP